MNKPIQDPLAHSFGKASVSQDEREQRIRRVFEGVASRYDLMNDLMSMGIHRLWKRSVARRVGEVRGRRIVDLAGGTGDIARLLSLRGARTVVVDPSRGMMTAGRSRPGHEDIDWLCGTGEALPLATDSVDVLTIAFGIRNVTRMEDALREILRVLKPGGRFYCLEFSTPWTPIRPFYRLFSLTVIPRLGAWVARNPEAYQYLIESIQRFPDQQSMKGIMERVGFQDVSYRNYSTGIAALHEGRK